ncbi:uncharacterized protein PAN0_083d6648 [Moesziomyces antarcticus]|nr:uncharacterized protein PAN0_083d6648 [Moesziomyces antarcticus]GAK68398.1 conserved hypothetical protein [Moesziomyces antarcticus]
MPPPHRTHDASGQPFPAAPPSPSLSTTTRASLDFPSRPAVLITRADLRTSLAAYEALLASAKAYTSSMLAMAKASSDLACALETCARVKGAHDSGPALQAASGLHFLKSNYEQVLCDTFWKDFSIPLLSHYDTYRSACTERQVVHDKAVSEKSKQLKEAEARNNRAGRKKERDLNSFRRALAELQSHVDAIDDLKAQYYNEVLDAEHEVWQFIESKVALIVRSQIEISERISSKGLNDPVLEQMLATIPDPFGSYGPPKHDGEIFSILHPISLLSSGANSIHNTSTEAPTNETSVTDAEPTSEDAKPSTASASHASASASATSVLPPNIMSPSTPSKGLSRASFAGHKNASAAATPTRASAGKATSEELPSSSTPKPLRAAETQASAASAATPKARGANASGGASGPTHVARDSLLGLSAVSEATTAISTSDGSAHTASGGLFGSESVDFEELLSREQHGQHHAGAGAADSADARDAATPHAPTHDAAQGDDDEADAQATAAGRLRQVLSIIEEDANGPHSRAARGAQASSRPVSSIYDAGPDPFADHTREEQTSDSKSSRDDAEKDAASRHSRTPSKASID